MTGYLRNDNGPPRSSASGRKRKALAIRWSARPNPGSPNWS